MRMSDTYICDWTLEDVQDWLRETNHGQYCPNFLKNGIDGEILTEMDDFDLVLLDIDTLDVSFFSCFIKKAKEDLTSKLQKKILDQARQKLIHDEICEASFSRKKLSNESCIIGKSRSEYSGSPEMQADYFCKKRNSDELVLPKNKVSPFNKRLSVRPFKRRGSRESVSPPIFRIQIDSDEKVREWTVSNVGVFLKKNTMGKYFRVFRKNVIDGECLLDMTFEDFQSLGLKRNEADVMFSALEIYKIEQNMYISIL